MTTDQLKPSHLDDVFTALADPTRRAILARLTDGDANVAELCRPFSMSQPAVSKHLKVLEKARLISRHRSATARYCHLETKALKEANVWLEDYRRFWDESYERLDEVLRDQLAQQKTTKQKGKNK
jgi:DNA-binding transcriptional ArsR family regulator